MIVDLMPCSLRENSIGPGSKRKDRWLPPMKLTAKVSENGWLEDDPFLFGMPLFQVRTVRFRVVLGSLGDLKSLPKNWLPREVKFPQKKRRFRIGAIHPSYRKSKTSLEDAIRTPPPFILLVEEIPNNHCLDGAKTS